MAAYYVWSGAVGAGTGADWANAFTTLATALITEVAGDTLYLAHDHAESTAGAISLTSNGTAALPTKVVCVNRSGSVPPVSADRRMTAQVTTTGTGNIQVSGFTHYDGIIFSAGTLTGASNITLASSSSMALRFDNCSLRLGSTGAGKILLGNGSASRACLNDFNNTTISFSAVGQSIELASILRWRNTPSALIGAAVPTSLFTSVAAAGGQVECVGVDLSAAGSGKTICNVSTSAIGVVFKFIDCKVNAAVTKVLAPTTPGACEVDFVRSDASGNYAVYRNRMQGTLDHETTIVRTGGASDGTTPIAWKVITTTTCTYTMPFECPPIAIWNDIVGLPVTATVEGIAATLPTDQEVWLDVEYLGDASSPQGSFINDGKADLLATAANQTTSTETWGGALTGKFKLNVTFTAQQKGWVYGRIKVGKASATVYIDPLVVLS